MAAREPCRSAAPLENFRIPPGLGPRLPGRWDRPEPPGAFPGVSVVCVQKTPEPGVSPGDAEVHKVSYDEGCGDRPVMIAVVGHFNVPRQTARPPVQCDGMGVVRDSEEQVAPHSHTPVQPDCRVPHQSLGAGPGVLPDLPSCLGVQGEYLVHPGDVHDAVDDDRRAFDHGLVFDGKEPLHLEVSDVP